MLNVVMLNVVMLNVVMLNVVMLSVIMLSAIMLSVVVPLTNRLDCISLQPNQYLKVRPVGIPWTFQNKLN
jgi:hypothetical protein